MASTEQRLMDAWNALSKCPFSLIHRLLTLLHKLEQTLSSIEQEPPKHTLEALTPSRDALIMRKLHRHTNGNVTITTISCLIEITRITAPNPPYDDEQMKDIFEVMVASFEKLALVGSGHNYEKAVLILQIVAKFKIFLIMLDLECDELVTEMFNHFLRNISSSHPPTVIYSMETIMTEVLYQSEEISSDLIKPLLDSVRKENETISPHSWTLAKKVITNCAIELKPYLMQAVQSTGRALSDYGQIVDSICQNESDKVVRADEKILDVSKDANDQSWTNPERKIEQLEASVSKPRVNEAENSENVKQIVVLALRAPFTSKELVLGSRIKVWWPMDRMFYEGVVNSYDPVKGRHKIVYDDGDIEVLNLERERWDLIKDDVSPNAEPETDLLKCKQASDIRQKGKEKLNTDSAAE